MYPPEQTIGSVISEGSVITEKEKAAGFRPIVVMVGPGSATTIVGVSVGTKPL
jgi:hypothetical protein